MKKILSIILQVVPIIVMIGLIPLIKSDWLLSVFYLVFILISLFIKHDKKDILFLLFGCVGLFFSEWLFISTGVEVFIRHSLFGLMPIWLPILWSYAFVVMKRVIVTLDN